MRLMKAHIALKTLLHTKAVVPACGFICLLVTLCLLATSVAQASYHCSDRYSPDYVHSECADSGSHSTQASNDWLRGMSQRELCVRALKFRGMGIAWDNRAGFQNFVNEAKRRDYTPESCAKTRPPWEAGIMDWDLCSSALIPLDLERDGVAWSSRSRRVAEAKRRGYTPESCAKRIGRNTQIAKKAEPKKKQDVAPVSKPATKLASEANKLKCEYKLASYHSPIVDGKKFVIDLKNGRLYRKSDFMELRQKAK